MDDFALVHVSDTQQLDLAKGQMSRQGRERACRGKEFVTLALLFSSLLFFQHFSQSLWQFFRLYALTWILESCAVTIQYALTEILDGVLCCNHSIWQFLRCHALS